MTLATPRRPRRSHRRLRRLTPGRLFGLLGAAVGVLAGLASLIDWVGAKTTTPAPARVDSNLLWAKKQDERVTLVDYLRENGKPTRGLTREEAGERGVIFAVRVRLRGRPGTQSELQWRMFHNGGEPLAGDIYEQKAGRFTTGARDHAATVQVWTPYPPRPGRYFVRFSLRDDRGRPLDFVTARFAAARIPA